MSDTIDSIKINGVTYDINLPTDANINVAILEAEQLFENGVNVMNIYALKGHSHEFGQKVGKDGSASYGTACYLWYEDSASSATLNYRTWDSTGSGGSYKWNDSFAYTFYGNGGYTIGSEPTLFINGSNLTNNTIVMIRFDGTKITKTGDAMKGIWPGISYFYFTRNGTTAQPYNYLSVDGYYEQSTSSHKSCLLFAIRNYINSSYPLWSGLIQSSSEISNNTTVASRKACNFFLIQDTFIFVNGAS